MHLWCAYSVWISIMYFIVKTALRYYRAWKARFGLLCKSKKRSLFRVNRKENHPRYHVIDLYMYFSFISFKIMSCSYKKIIWYRNTQNVNTLQPFVGEILAFKFDACYGCSLGLMLINSYLFRLPWIFPGIIQGNLTTLKLLGTAYCVSGHRYYASHHGLQNGWHFADGI